ncbi:MAG: hypothetical protein ACRECV_06840 [Xanthobacteraceae bacterium]
MRARGKFAILPLAVVLAAVSILAACTKGGQFDPTTLLDNDMFDNKTPLKGQRQPVFPTGVPGVTSGIPADLYKGYQPPPEQAADNGGVATSILPAAEQHASSEARVEPKAKPKAKPKERTARAPAKRRRTEITVGLSKRPKPTSQQAEQSSPTVWPAPPPTNQAQSSQTVWPAPPTTAAAQSSQSIWPAPPPTGAQ